MSDTITQDDLILSEERTELEKKLETTKRDKQIIEDRMKSVEEKMDKFIVAMSKLDKLIGKMV